MRKNNRCYESFRYGVDISDIDRVYHVAPSSTFVDYIQEIGRAARDKNITGVAVTDFNERDFYLYETPAFCGCHLPGTVGMILKKVWEIYLMKGCSDEMQMSLSDFEFAVKICLVKRTSWNMNRIWSKSSKRLCYG